MSAPHGRFAPLAAALLVAALAPFGGLAAALAAADGNLDPTFQSATGGVLRFGAPGDAAAEILVPAPDGAFVAIAGFTTSGGTPNQDLWKRVTSSGAGASCSLTFPGVASFEAAGAMFDFEGRLVVVGTAYDGSQRLIAERFLYPACDLDESFDGDGVATWLAGETPRAAAVAWLRTVIPPFVEEHYYLLATVAGGGHIELVRLDTDGGLDTTWAGGDGRAAASVSGASVFARAMVLDAHGRFMVAAGLSYTATGNIDFGAFRFTSSGALDVSFDGNGRKGIPFDMVADGADVVQGLAVSSADRIAFVGYATTATGSLLAVAVLRDDGAFDTGFGGGDGKVLVDLSDAASPISVGHAALYQGDGKLLLAGLAKSAANLDTAYVARLTGAGSLDATFDGNGVYVPSGAGFDGFGHSASGLALDAGRPLVGGLVDRAARAVSHYDAYLLRLENGLVFADGFESGTFAFW